jgi:hypothetical protein
MVKSWLIVIAVNITWRNRFYGLKNYKDKVCHGDTACKCAGTDVAISADYFSILLIIASQY